MLTSGLSTLSAEVGSGINGSLLDRSSLMWSKLARLYNQTFLTGGGLIEGIKSYAEIMIVR